MCHYIGGAFGFSSNFLYEFLGESHINYLVCMVLEDFGVGVVRRVEDRREEDDRYLLCGMCSPV